MISLPRFTAVADLNLFYDGNLAHQPSVSIAKRIGDTLFALAFNCDFGRQRGTPSVSQKISRT